MSVDVSQSPLETKVGAVAETAPASDTASSGLNGRLQRIAQRLTSLIALVPSALSGSGNFKTAVQEALPAGTNNIGDVDVLTVPADPFGVNADAAVAAGAAGSIQAKLRRATQGLEDLKTLIVLAAGSAVIGKVGIDQTTPGTSNGVQVVPGTTGGLTTYHLVSAGSTNAAVVKAGAGQLYGWYIYNSNAAARKLAFHNSASSPTAGASVYFTLVIPPGSAANVMADIGIAFSAGIAITTVTGLADSDTTAVAANDLNINLFYK